MTNTEDLEQAGILDGHTLSRSDRQKIDDLTAQEVVQLKALFGKLGDTIGRILRSGGRPLDKGFYS